jgi:hypothetical protein
MPQPTETVSKITSHSPQPLGWGLVGALPNNHFNGFSHQSAGLRCPLIKTIEMVLRYSVFIVPNLKVGVNEKFLTQSR